MNKETIELLNAIQRDHKERYSNVEKLVSKWNQQQRAIEESVAPLKQAEEIVKKQQELLNSIKRIEESQRKVFIFTKRIAAFGSASVLGVSVVFPYLFIPFISVVTAAATFGYMWQLKNDKDLNKKGSQAVDAMKTPNT